MRVVKMLVERFVDPQVRGLTIQCCLGIMPLGSQKQNGCPIALGMRTWFPSVSFSGKLQGFRTSFPATVAEPSALEYEQVHGPCQLLALEAVAGELQGAAVFGDSADDVVGSA